MSSHIHCPDFYFGNQSAAEKEDQLIKILTNYKPMIMLSNGTFTKGTRKAKHERKSYLVKASQKREIQKMPYSRNTHTHTWLNLYKDA